MKAVSVMALLSLGTISVWAEVANMSGTWVLNKDRSDWNAKSPPTGVILHIEHREPLLKYTGSVTEGGTEKDQTRFSFDGAIDGKEHTIREGSGARSKILFKRTSDDTVESVLKSPDGKTIEESSTKLSSDGKTLVRKIKQRTADNKTGEWTEIYERR
jgi:hypothetical protein